MTSRANSEIDNNVKTSSSGECYASIDKHSRWTICNLRKSKWVSDKKARGPKCEHLESAIVIQSGVHKHSWREAYACFSSFLQCSTVLCLWTRLAAVVSWPIFCTGDGNRLDCRTSLFDQRTPCRVLTAQMQQFPRWSHTHRKLPCCPGDLLWLRLGLQLLG